MKLRLSARTRLNQVNSDKNQSQNNLSKTPHRFHGQQTDEVIISTIRPEKIALIFQILFASIILIIVLFMWWRLNYYFADIVGGYEVIGYITLILAFAAHTFLKSKAHKKSVSYLTDRRLVNINVSLLQHLERKSMFWKNITRVRETDMNLFWGILGLGVVEIYSYDQQNNSDIQLTHVKKHRDLANYIEKVVYTVNEQPDQISELKPFTAKRNPEFLPSDN